MRLFEMRRRRSEVQARMSAIHEAGESREDHSLTEAEQTEFDALSTELRSLNERITRAEQIDQLDAQARSDQERADAGDTEPESDFEAELQTRNYSLLRAAERFASHRSLDGWEGEVSAELANRTRQKPQGFLMPQNLPFDVRAARRGAASLGQRRTAGTLDTTAGAGAVPTVTPVNTMIELLRNRAVLLRAGVTLLTNLYGAFSIPKQTQATTTAWVAEGGEPTAGNVTIGTVSLSPKTLASQTLITRRMQVQASLDVEMVAREDLVLQQALGIDSAGLAGAVATPQNSPIGVLHNASISAAASSGTNGGALTWENLIALETAITSANADIGPMAYITSPKVRGHAKTTAKIGSTYPVFLMDDNGEMNGYPTFITNNAPTNLTKGTSTGTLASIFFGVWNQLYIGMWGALDILADPYTSGASGGVKLYALQDLDIKPRHTEAFSYLNDVDPS